MGIAPASAETRQAGRSTHPTGLYLFSGVLELYAVPSDCVGVLSLGLAFRNLLMPEPILSERLFNAIYVHDSWFFINHPSILIWPFSKSTTKLLNDLCMNKGYN